MPPKQRGRIGGCGPLFQFSIWDAGLESRQDARQPALSILYLRCHEFSAATVSRRRRLDFQFSIWDAHQSGSRRRSASYNFQFSIWDAEYACGASAWSTKANLSILYLRCGTPPDTEYLSVSTFSFNSLFEMPNQALQPWRRLLLLPFQFSIWDANALGPATNATITKHFQFSIWDAGCPTWLSQRWPRRLSILYLRCGGSTYPTWLHHHPRLSILYLRCGRWWSYTTTHVVKLSILYLRC